MYWEGEVGFGKLGRDGLYKVLVGCFYKFVVFENGVSG
jgi:hypothetical protein